MELWERLRSQEILSRNEKFICKLPDEGEKIPDTNANLKAAMADHGEVGGRSELFDPVCVDWKLRQRAATRADTDVDKAQNSDLMLDPSPLVSGCSSADIKSSKATPETPGPAHLLTGVVRRLWRLAVQRTQAQLPAAEPGHPCLK